ncbi:MAG: hypothetical protein QXV37_00525 [Candidatus Jordarchaeaceae archaeon]
MNKKRAILISCLLVLSTILIGLAISQSQYTNAPLAPITYIPTTSTQPGLPPVAKCHATVIVTDCNNIPIEGANVTDGSTTKVTDAYGTVEFHYSSPGWRTFTADYYGEKNSSGPIWVGSVTVHLTLGNITTIYCKTQYNISGQIIPLTSAYITVTNKTSGVLIAQRYVNSTGWAKFHLVRSDTPIRGTNYTLRAFWLNGTQIQIQEDHSNERITTTTELFFTLMLTQTYIPTIVLVNATALQQMWGTDVYLRIHWGYFENGQWYYLNASAVGGNVSYTLNFINGTRVYGPVVLSPAGVGGEIYYDIVVPSWLLYGGKTYQIYMSAYAGSGYNYLPAVNQTILSVTPLQMIMDVNRVLSGIINEQVTLTLRLNNSESNTPVTGANVEYTVWDGNNNYIDSGVLEENSSTYCKTLNLTYPVYSPGTYYVELYAERENYTTVEKAIVLDVKHIPSVLRSATFYLSELKNPKIFFCSNYGQTENDVPFAVLIFQYEQEQTKSSISDNEIRGTEISGASVSVAGLPSISLGNGYYAVVIPTYGLPPSAYPLIVSASGGLYEPQQLVFILQGKERSVLIPLLDIRVPISMLLVALFAMALPGSGFSGYVYYKRARIPALVRRIDQMIVAMSRGEKVDVKIFPREKLTSKILAEELSIIGVEPRLEAYVPLELAGLIVPLLAESGMSYHEANVLVTELVKASPSEREKLLQSVGVPEEISATILKIIEDEEDRRRERAEIIRKPVIEKEIEEPAALEAEAKEDKKSETVKTIRRARKVSMKKEPEKEAEKEASVTEAKAEKKEDKEAGYGKYERI